MRPTEAQPLAVNPIEADGADARAYGYGLDRNPYTWGADRGSELDANRAKREAWAKGWNGAATATRARLFIQCYHGDRLGTFLRTRDGVLVSSVHTDSVNLYEWAQGNGWRPEGGLNSDWVRDLPTFTVTGSEGTLTVCADTGDVLARTPDAYPTFTRIDVAEWRAFYPGEELAGQSVDILDTAGWQGEDYSPAEADFRVELAFANGCGEFIHAERFRSVEVCGWIEADGAIEAIPGQPASAAHGFGVYGREAEGDPLAVHLFDMKAHASALTLAREYAGALPVADLVGEG